MLGAEETGAGAGVQKEPVEPTTEAGGSQKDGLGMVPVGLTKVDCTVGLKWIFLLVTGVPGRLKNVASVVGLKVKAAGADEAAKGTGV